MKSCWRCILALAIMLVAFVPTAGPVHAQAQDEAQPEPIENPGNVAETQLSEIDQLRSELDEARNLIERQNLQLQEQQKRLDLLEQRILGVAQTTQQIRDEQIVAQTVTSPGNPPVPGVRTAVGEAPRDNDRPPVVAVLGQRGSVMTKRGEFVGELGIDYTRADRNRAVFRGIELLESVLVGVFDINETRQDIFTGSAALRYGVTDRLEFGVRVPWVTRSDKAITAPVAGSTNDDLARTIDNSVNNSNIGDLELTARYQLNDGGRNTPFLIANLQATIPTGDDPFSIRRDQFGIPLESATGAGYYGISPSLTAILPTEPAVLFGTLGYTFNLAENVETIVPPVQIEKVDPGDQLAASVGIGLSLNDRTSINFGYNHTWAFSTKTWTRQLDEQTGVPVGERELAKSRDLQVGRFLFGISQKFSDKIQLNWSMELGATEDAPDVRVAFRLPIKF